MTIAWAYSLMKQPEQSFASAMAALGLVKATGDPEIEGAIETSMMLGFRKQHRPEEAIFFGLEAVNSYQQIRQNIAGLDKELRRHSRNRSPALIARWPSCSSRPAGLARPSRFSICSRSRS